MARPLPHPPQPLIDFMMSGWSVSKASTPVEKVEHLAEFRARRKALSKQFPGEALVIPTGHEKIRANDTAYLFRPGTHFFYLVGNHEPDCVLLMLPTAKGHESVLFVEPAIDHSTPAFFTDRARGAFWVGARLGLDGSLARYGVDRALPLTQLPDQLRALASSKRPYRMLRGLTPSEELLPVRADRKTADFELAEALAKMRLLKSDAELQSLDRALRSTKRAYEAALRALRRAKNERELEAAFDHVARVEGSGVGYATIVAGGAHACVMHWTRNNGPLKKGELVLMDAGVEGRDLYTADITRTFPVNGTFSPAQRAIYDLVIAAQDAAIKAVKPGNAFMAPHQAAIEVLVRGIHKLGILTQSPEEALRDECPLHKRFTIHSVSHMLGLDVHDNDPYNYRTGTLEPGMVLTIEPGLYFQANDATVPAKYRGIGIRVEEDVLVTPKGAKVLSRAIPRTADAVEAWIASLWK